MKEDLNDDMVLSITVGDDGFQDVWIFYSSCHYYMCPNRDAFSTYKFIEGRVILMDNGKSCKILEIVIIKIKIYDGVLRTLISVRHVPNLKMNLISLGELDFRGCTTFMKNESMKIL